MTTTTAALKFRRRLTLILWGIPTLVMVNDAVGTVSLVKDDGMYPSIRKGDLVLVDRTPTRKLSAGAVVLMRNPEATRGATHFRIIRRLEHKSDTRFGKFSYVKDHKDCEIARDSADFGPIPEAIVLGRVIAVAFPPWRAGWPRFTPAPQLLGSIPPLWPDNASPSMNFKAKFDD